MEDLVRRATERAERAGFAYSCDPGVGRLLAVLAAGLPARARVLEIGTGTGVGTAWLVSGLTPRTDVTVTTIEYDAARAGLARQGEWPGFVEFRTGDALAMLPGLRTFDLIFADSPAGKHERLDLTLGALGPGGTLLVDDMTADPAWPAEFRERQEGVRRTLLADPALAAVELAHGSGIILATRRAT
ncbi:O-methyltransferase [Nonomuraea harbinensis]|uniref:O-methyltransferase n=1 Tax=Nonomuraea harbinensis TaxID=1286938 RepID=A0ABW1BPK1_9ACTN|nr:class I SAM-dependent methyltransferase [Nonomuraea harbinensis]